MVAEFLRAIRATHKYPSRPKLYYAAHKNPLSRGELKAWNGLYDVFRGEWTISMEVHLGLNEAQERQIFHALNNLVKKVEESLAYKFDDANPVNRFIKHELVKFDDDGGFWKPKLAEKDVLGLAYDEGGLSRKDLIGIKAVLFLNQNKCDGCYRPSISR